MQHKNIIFAFSLGLSLAIALLWALGAGSSPATAAINQLAALPQAELHVCLSGCLYDNVQEAVDAASEGSIIKVAGGAPTLVLANGMGSPRRFT
jgi:hypothetical protein